MTKNRNKKVILKLSTYQTLSEKEKQNIVLVVTSIINSRVYFNEKKSIYVGFHIPSQKSSNIFKKATFVREFKIPAAHLNQL